MALRWPLMIIGHRQPTPYLHVLPPSIHCARCRSAAVQYYHHRRRYRSHPCQHPLPPWRWPRPNWTAGHPQTHRFVDPTRRSPSSILISFSSVCPSTGPLRCLPHRRLDLYPLRSLLQCLLARCSPPPSSVSSPTFVASPVCSLVQEPTAPARPNRAFPSASMTELISSVVINATEVRESPSRHVVYQLSIRTPSRSWTVWRRYSEFETLHSLLRELSPTPFGLPPKSFSIWGNTLSDPSKVEARRLGLETYVQTILNHENDLWKTSKAWFDFIALPESSRRLSILGRTPSNGGGNPTDPAGVVASAPVDRPLYTTESWMNELRDMQQFCKEIRTKIAARDRFAQAGDTASMQYASMQGKKGLGVVSTRISDLEYALAQHKPAPGQGRPSSVSSGEPAALQRLPSATRSTVLTAGEYSRRQDLLDSLKEERDVLSKLLSSNPSVYRQPRVDSAERNALLGFGSIGAGGYSSSVSTSPNESFGTVPTGSSAASSTARPNNTTPPRSTRRFGQPKETEQTRALDQQGLLQLQKQTMNQQDQSVDMLSSILQRQKQIGLAISDELDTQNSLLEDLDENVDRVGRNLKKADKRLANVRKG